MKKSRILIFVLLIIFCISSVYGLSFGVSYYAEKNQIFLDENSIYTVELTNYENYDERYQIFTTDIGWHVDLEPAIIKLGPYETINITLELLLSLNADFNSTDGA